jgi:AcrR family transcriptional regulator
MGRPATQHGKASDAPPQRFDELADPEQLSGWISEGKLPELSPTHQRRSLETALRLLESGWRLLRDHPLEDLSVEMVCRSARVPSGSFYARFASKRAYFLTLLRVHFIGSYQRRRNLAARTSGNDISLSDFCLDYVRTSVTSYRRGIGIMRAVFQQTDEESWCMYRASADLSRDLLFNKLSGHFPDMPPEMLKERILLAHQIVMGTMVHLTLDGRGPLTLFDDRVISELAHMMELYLNAPPRRGDQ